MTEIRGQAFAGQLDEATRSIILSTELRHLHLLRHGDVEKLTHRVVRGQMDVGLSEAGIRQHEALADWLTRAEPRPDVLWSSDLRRCRELAERIGRLYGIPVRAEARLREQSLGAWEGRTWPEVTESEPEAVRAYWADYVEARPTRGESLKDLRDRVLGWWREQAQPAREERLFVVTHIGVIRVLFCHVLGLPLDQALRFSPATASHTSLILAEAGPVLSSFGERPWL